ncbi:MAG: YggT family protein [Gemmatimonadaceae bacterium]|nr:YggT family protein [Gemmatimonadaceae bacterium]
MEMILGGADVFITVVRVALMVLALILGVVCIIDWAVRTRRIGPFNAVARFFRSTVDPFLAPIERRVVRAGGLPANAPLWALTVVVIGGFLLLSALDFLRSQIFTVTTLASSGPAGILRLAITAVFSVLRIAIIVSVIASWLPISPFSRWIRWSHRLSEPLLRPVRQFVPTLGGFDFSPIITYFVLGLIESAILRIFQLM